MQASVPVEDYELRSGRPAQAFSVWVEWGG